MLLFLIRFELGEISILCFTVVKISGVQHLAAGIPYTRYTIYQVYHIPGITFVIIQSSAYINWISMDFRTVTFGVLQLVYAVANFPLGFFYFLLISIAVSRHDSAARLRVCDLSQRRRSADRSLKDMTHMSDNIMLIIIYKLL